MAGSLLKNGEFEADWGLEQSHRCLVLEPGEEPFVKNVGNIFVPPGWTFWFRHDPGTWDQPEGRDAHRTHDPRRVKSGDKAYMYFTFFRRHDAGLFQQVRVAPGARLRLTAWAHAWSNTQVEGHEGCFQDARCSCGVGRDEAFILEGDAPALSGDPWMDAIQNFTFRLGVDPTGGTNPLAATVVWGQGAHVYNGHACVPAVEVEAQADRVTVFLRSTTMWSFKHNDAYWDDVVLALVGDVPDVPLEVQVTFPGADPGEGTPTFELGETARIEVRASADPGRVQLRVRQPSGKDLSAALVQEGRDGDWYLWGFTTLPLREVGVHSVTLQAAGAIMETSAFECAPPPEPDPAARGLPREQYERTYVLLPPGAGKAWALAVVNSVWESLQYTFGGSADDAGIGALDVRRVIAINPGEWRDDLEAFCAQYYPSVEYVAVEAETPDELERKLARL